MTHWYPDVQDAELPRYITGELSGCEVHAKQGRDRKCMPSARVAGMGVWGTVGRRDQVFDDRHRLVSASEARTHATLYYLRIHVARKLWIPGLGRSRRDSSPLLPRLCVPTAFDSKHVEATFRDLQ